MRWPEGCIPGPGADGTHGRWRNAGTCARTGPGGHRSCGGVSYPHGPANHVPVALSEDGSAIISYPDPTDLRTPGGPPIPTKLEQGWLLDRRGIGMNSAFLEMTYADYAALVDPPSMVELEAALLDREPITDMCDCGPRTAFMDPVAELDRIIRNDSLYIRCKRLK